LLVEKKKKKLEKMIESNLGKLRE